MSLANIMSLLWVNKSKPYYLSLFFFFRSNWTSSGHSVRASSCSHMLAAVWHLVHDQQSTSPGSLLETQKLRPAESESAFSQGALVNRVLITV